jgi:PncC family amidohydrolase
MTRELFVGQKPETVDFSDPALPPGFDVEKINAGILVAVAKIEERGWRGDTCMILPDETAGPMIEQQLSSARYDCVVIGDGPRLPPKSLVLFERVVNAVRKAAPGAAIAFNTRPEDAGEWRLLRIDRSRVRGRGRVRGRRRRDMPPGRSNGSDFMLGLDGIDHARVARIAGRLVGQKETIAISESSAGGLISAALLTVPGASAYFLGGGVIYTRKAMGALLALTPDDLEGMRSATEPMASLLAQTVRGRLGADWGLAETGATGPTGNRYGDAAGHACLAVAGRRIASRILETGSNDRTANMVAFADAALELLEETLLRAD